MTTPNDPQALIQRARELDAKRTPGKWYVGPGDWTWDGEFTHLLSCQGRDGVFKGRDIQFIQGALDLLPALAAVPEPYRQAAKEVE